MKKFVVCNSSRKVWRNNLSGGDEHLIIYCKDIKTIFEALRDQINSHVRKITIHLYTEDPQLSINPYLVPNLEVNTCIREINFNCYTHDYWLSLVLSLFPNVENLYFFKLTKEKLKYIAENLEHVRNIRCNYSDNDLVEYYHELITQRKDINTDININ